MGGSNAYPDPASKNWVGPDPEKHIGSTLLARCILKCDRFWNIWGFLHTIYRFTPWGPRNHALDSAQMVDTLHILNVVRKGAAAMWPLTAITAATCSQFPNHHTLWWICLQDTHHIQYAFSALPLLVGCQEEHPACNNERWGVGVVICLQRGADCLHMVQLMPLPKPHHLLPYLNPDWFYLSGTGLPRLYWKRGR